jgi:hypothetical protein
MLPVVHAATEGGPETHEPNAVVINLTEEDLNLLLREAFLTTGGRRIEGVREQVAGGLSDLRYEAQLSDPELTLGENGRMSLRCDIRRADVRISSLERRIGRRVARCENLGVVVDPRRPVEFRLDLRFSVEASELRVVPEMLRLDDARRNMRLIRPSRCENAILPRWLLWWIGKPMLRRRLGKLDQILLASARRSAEDLNRSGGLLRGRRDKGDDTMQLYPRSLETDEHSLTMILAGSERAPTSEARPDWIDGRRDGTFIAFSQSFLNQLLASSLPKGVMEPSEPHGPLRTLFESSSLYTLIPGLRDLPTRDGLHFSLALSAPMVELDRIPFAEAGLDPALVREPIHDRGERALLRLHLSGIELSLWQIDETERSILGTLRIDSGRVAVVPFFNVLGGISFELVENEWEISSSGIEFNEQVLAATIQEVVFGEVYETRIDPLARGALRIGDVELAPRGFRVVEDYLLVEVGGDPESEGARGRALLASR